MLQFLKNAAAKVRGQRRPVRRRSRRPLCVECLEDRTLLSLSWGTLLGHGDGFSDSSAIAVDPAGNAYVAGHVWNGNRGYDVSVAKLSSSGDRVLWLATLGGSNHEYAYDLALGSDGSVYVVGNTGSLDFPTTAGAYDTTLAASSSYSLVDAFITKLNPLDGSLVYSTFLGGTRSFDEAYAVAVDASGSVYVAGRTFPSPYWFGSDFFPTTAGAYDTTFNGSSDAFVAKLSPAGDALLWATFLGGSAPSYSELANAIAVDPSGNVYVAGRTESADFPTTPGTISTGGVGSFVTKLSPGGDALLWSAVVDVVVDVARDDAGDIYVGGYATGPSYYYVAYVAKLSPEGDVLFWNTLLSSDGVVGVGDSIVSLVRGVAVGAGGVHVTGYSRSSSFPTTAGAYDTTFSGLVDAFVTTINPTDGAVVYSTFLGGTGNDYGSDIAVDRTGNAYVVGETSSPDFPTMSGSADTTFGDRDVFVAKFGFGTSPGDPPPDQPPGEPPDPIEPTGPFVVTMNPQGRVSSEIRQVEVTFDASIAPRTFTARDVAITSPSGRLVRIGRVQQVSDRTFRVPFAPQTALGEYRITIGPDIRDLAGNPMNQDRDVLVGELIEDRFAGSFEIVPRTFVFSFLGFCGQVGEDPPSGIESLSTAIAADAELSASYLVVAPPLGWPSVGCHLIPAVVRFQMRTAQRHIQTFLQRNHASPHDQVVLIGHSYGGNMAYNLAEDARPDLRGRQPAAGLVTLDPIDWTLCPPICSQSVLVRPAPRGMVPETIRNFVQRNPREVTQGYTIAGAQNDDVLGRGPDGRWGTIFQPSRDDTKHSVIDNDVSPGNDGRVGTEDDVFLGIFDAVRLFLRRLVAG